MTKYAYMRVSTKKQGSKFGLSRQQMELERVGIDPANMIHDEISGTKKSRPGLDHLKSIVKPNDTITVVSLDRLGRSTVDVINLIEEFRSQQVYVISLKENIDTSRDDAFTNFFITMLSAFSTLEREMMLERQQMAYDSMREQGIKLQGRPPVDPEKLQASVDLYLAGGKSYRDVEAITGVSASRICRAVKAYRESQDSQAVSSK